MDAAIACPTNPGRVAAALANEGGALNGACRFEEAEAVLTRAVALDPTAWGAWSNLGNTMVEQQRYDDAIACFGRCLRINASHGPAWANLGVALTRRGEPALALRMLDQAVALQPGNAASRCNRALALLAAGDYPQGFAEYEWRLALLAPLAPRLTRVPLWDGKPLEGRTLLVHGEGGFGDMLQFVRFVPLLRRFGGRVVLQVRRPLLSLLSRLDGIDLVLAEDEALPPVDLRCSVLSLPLRFGTTLGTIPAASGYLVPDEARAQGWRQAWGDARVPQVGLVWAGAPHPGVRDVALADRRRSLTFDRLAPLLALPDIRFHSLQVGPAADQAASWPQVADHAADLRSFDDTAALVAALDLVIAVDTSTAHLAGALGRPVWMLSRFDGCWRWLTGRDDTPWYDSMRLYRQTVAGDWTDPVARLATDLRNWSGRWTSERREASLGSNKKREDG